MFDGKNVFILCFPSNISIKYVALVDDHAYY